MWNYELYHQFRQHCYKVYLQVQKWLIFTGPKFTCCWGWIKGEILTPVKMTKFQAPKSLLQ